jgi:hypothetical protein
MAQADRATGKEAFIEFTPTAGSAIVLDTDYRDLNINRSLNEVDATAGDDDWQYMVDSFKNGEITLTVLAGDEDYDDIVIGQTGTLVYGRRGNAASARKESIPVKVMSVSEASSYADVQALDITFRQTGDATIGTFTV